ncbi:GRAM domain-containing protein 2B-like isoform X3 [Anguilla rostrata]|uniref:GRAM domain-containing protein 2B-like isoform X3 n=1 Tax=Anguilla rostrata TaxID=7938 RepID=UPI0030CC1CBF
MVLITEPSTSFLTPQTTPEEVKSIKFAKKDVKTTQSNSDPENGGEDRAKRNGKPGTDPLPAPDTESDAPEVRRKPSLKRSKVIDQTPLLQNPSDTEAKAEGKKAQSSQSKTNGQYHKLFKEISKEELLKQSYTCALQKDMLFHGKLYVSDNWICFHSKVFGRGIKIVIPVLSVTLIKKTKTAILVPNALVIATADERHVFVSFLSRDTTYKFLKSICPHLEAEKKMGHDSKPSSTESSFRSERPASLQLDFSAGFSDLDGVVRKRRQKLSESSSSGSQTPDYEKPAGHVKPTAEPQRGTPPQPGALNSLLLLYLLLVCVLVLSSCYMAFKIMSLEERLSALGSLAEYPLNENGLHYRDQLDVGNAEIYGELSTNLLKLEKVQKNLRKLLEET